MPIIWMSKSSGRPLRGGGCFGCIPIPIGCGLTAALALMIALAPLL